MFSNDISTAFMLDLLLLVFFFLGWSWKEAKTHGIKYIFLIWTFAFGIARGLPLFLYMRESKFEKS